MQDGRLVIFYQILTVFIKLKIMSMELNGVNNCFESYSLNMKLLNTWCCV